jgi:transglutaminase-like putative cysteine protease
VTGAIERFPPSLFLRETPLTKSDDAIAGFAAAARTAAGGDTLKLLHGLLAGLAFTLKRGVCQDLTHIFIAAARSVGIPARYISGHFHRSDGVLEQDAGHAWAEAFVPNLGWVAFDAANGICATDAHIRIAVGLDYLGAAPVRGTRYGGAGETLAVNVHVNQTQRQSQS